MAVKTGKVRHSAADGGRVGDRKTPTAVTAQELANIVTNDRRARKKAWPDYAVFIGVPQSTIYKIAKGRTTQPHETTVSQILDTIRLHPP